MDVLDFIQRNGMQEVPNPNYNPKSKKNKQPPIIKAPQLQPTSSNAVNMAIVDFNNQYSITKEENDKYSSYGLNYSPLDNMDKELANAQSTATKFGNALAQTFVSELGIGTIKAGSDLIDFIGQAVGLSSPDYTNPVSEFLEKKQEEFRNYAPIYADPDKNILNGGLANAGWWANNIPSIISSLTLLLPGMAVTGLAKVAGVGKAVGKLTRASKAVQKATNKIGKIQQMREAGATEDAINKAVKLSVFDKALTSPTIKQAANVFAENTTTAALSRTMENYQEARQTYNDVYLQANETLKNMSDEDYQKVLDKNSELLKEFNIDGSNREEFAKAIAKKGADETFRLDWLNVGFDVLQMYALRGMFTGKGISGPSSSKVWRANKDAIKYKGKSAEEIAAIKKDRSLLSKAKEWGEDRFHGSKTVIGAEWTEGVEEAVNYIAQQEGIHLGKYLTNETDEEHNSNFWDNVLSGFDGRIKDYVIAPQLWDSFFWGVMGGVVFQGLGSKAKQIQQSITNRSKLTEAERKQTPWYQFDALPQDKAKISEIQGRAILHNQYQANMERINSGIDIYHSTPEGEVRFSTTEEQELAKQRLLDEYADALGMGAIQAGTMDMLKAYMANDNIRQGLIERGLFNEKDAQGNIITRPQSEVERESKEFVDNVVNRLNKLEETYNQELATTDRLVGYINSRNKNNDELPAEYVQIIAAHNVARQRELDNIRPTINTLDAQIDNQLQQLIDEGKIDGSLDTKRNIRMELYANHLGILRNKRKEILKADPENNLSNIIALRNIDRQIAYAESQIEQDYNSAQVAYIIGQSLRYIKNNDGTFSLGNTPEYYAYTDKLITNREPTTIGQILDLNDHLAESYVDVELSRVLSDSEVGEYNTIQSDIKTTFDAINNVAPNIVTDMDRLESYKIAENTAKNDLIRTVDEVEEYASMINNTVDEARKKAITDSYKILRELRKDYGNIVEDAIYYLFNGYNINNIALPDDVKTQLKDAIDVIALQDKRKAASLDDILQAFVIDDSIEAQQNTRQNNPPQPNNSQQSSNNQPQPTSSNPPQSPQNSQSNNSSSQSQNGSNQANGGQNQGQTQQIDRQNLSNRTADFVTTGRNIEGVDTNNNYNDDVAFYNNQDGTFTIDTSANDAYYAQDTLYENGSGVDLLRPIRVTSFPIVEKNSNGTYDVIEKGTWEYADSPQTPNQTPNQTPSQPTTNNNPSTGVPNQTQPTPSNNTQEDIVNINLDDTQELNRLTATSLFDIMKSRNIKDPNIDIDSLEAEINNKKTELINNAVAQGMDERIAERTVDKASAIITRMINNIRNKQNQPTLASSVDELIFNQYSLPNTYSPNSSANPVVAYKQTLYQMLNQYAAEQGLEKFENKYYINLEDLLRYINILTNDSSTAKDIFDALEKQLNTAEAKESFVIIDKDEIKNKDNFFNNINKSQEERIAEREKNESSYSLDINRILRDGGKENEEQTYQALESLRIGDELNIQIERQSRLIWFTDNQGRKVGSMPIPRVNPRTGSFAMTNQGWHYDISPATKGFDSALYNYFLKIFNPTDNTSKKFLSSLYEYTFAQLDETRKEQLYNELKNSSTITQARELGFIDDEVEPKVILEHLSKLVKFMGNVQASRMFRLSANDIRAESIKQWFTKLYENYDIVNSIANNASGTYSVRVKGVLLGNVIRDQETVTNPQALNTPNDAIVGGVNLNENKIAVSHPNDRTSLLVAGGPSASFITSSQGNTFVTLPNQYGQTAFIQAYPVKLNDSKLGNKAKEIRQAIYDEVYRLFEEYNNNGGSIESRNAIQDFFSKLINSRNGNSTLFKGIVISEKRNSISISAPGVKGAIILTDYPNSTSEGIEIFLGNEGKAGFNSSKFKDILKNTLDNLQFQFSYAYYSSDNNPSTQLNGIATRKDGKFVITIGNKNWEFESFNDFVLNQSVVRINTKPNASRTSNFERSFNNNDNVEQTFKIDIIRNTSTPVEERVQAQSTTSTNINNSGLNVNEKVKNILTSNESDKGINILNTIIGTDNIFNEENIKIFKNLDLLPKSIIFDEHFNDNGNTENARVNLDNNEVTVGQQWLDLFNSPLTRQRAIRILMHEQIHILLNSKKGKNAIASIQSIKNEFAKALEDDNIKVKLIDVGLNVEHLKQYLFEGNENGLEEFLVESLTNSELAIALNTIDSRNPKTGKVANLFQRILNTLAKIFGWNVRKGSLLEEELYTIRTTMSKNNNENSNNSNEEESADNNPSTGEVDQTNQESQTPATTNINPQDIPSVEPIQQLPLKNGTLNRANRDRRFRRSEVEEQVSNVNNKDNVNLASNIPDISTFTTRLPLTQQAKFGSLINRGEVSVSCK